MQKIQPVRGTKDLYGTDKKLMNAIVDLAREIALRYDFQELETPIFEFSELFERNLGETSDVVAKEVYRFQDRGDNFLTLRPEFTAGVVRAFLSNSELQQRLPVKLFSTGAVFRYDRPQQGRQRQFHQVNFEYLGGNEPLAEAELLSMLWSFLQHVLDTQKLTLEINHLGTVASRQQYLTALVAYLQRFQSDLSADSQRRLLVNPLRILDSKDARDREILTTAPLLEDFYTAETKESFSQLLQLLQELQIPYKITPTLVRGLDYYTGTVFEFTTTQLGAQGTVLAGGRYDNLVQQLGYHQPLPSLGAAAGIERLLLLSQLSVTTPPLTGFLILGDTPELQIPALRLTDVLRRTQVVRIYQGHNLKKLLAKAATDQVQLLYILGTDELQQGIVRQKQMESGQETLLPLLDLLAK